MYTEKQLQRMFGKLRRLETMLEPRLFQAVDTIELAAAPTDGHYHSVPQDLPFAACPDGTVFEGEGLYCWFKGSYTVPEALAGKTLFIWPRIAGYEGMLWVDEKPYGNFASKIIEGSHGNHYCDLLCQNAAAGQTLALAFEYYANHHIRGTQPFTEEGKGPFTITYHPVDICLKDEELAAFYFDLKIANQMVEVLDAADYARVKFVRALLAIHEFIDYDIDNAEPAAFREHLRRADALLQEALRQPNAASAPFAGLIGHSHMDTAWLWHRGETEKKCARTYANQMNLMDQYPDYTFIQSSAYHSDIIKRMYPALFEDIKRRVAEGRYEPNGGVWIECDCNIPTGEYMVRQFLWGQKFTRENFGYTSDAFWLPDTFGYSASLPQIMQGCGIKYFLTTKLAWNDTNEFPYDTFWWKGLDGSKVLVHFNRTRVWPDPKTFQETMLNGQGNTIKERAVAPMRLISYGFGDGGGGPEFGMVEMAERLKDVEGMPRTAHTTVSAFMQKLESSLVQPSTYNGELYLELHRGTLTNQHRIKQNNRRAEFALRDLEYLTVRDALASGTAASGEAIDPLTNGLLINQFHDILPGTCIPRAHDEAIAEVSGIIEKAGAMSAALLKAQAKPDTLTVVNTLSFERADVLYLALDGRYLAGDMPQQVVTLPDGSRKLAVAGVKIPAFGSTVLPLTAKAPVGQASAFAASGNSLETPFAKVRFNAKGYIESFVDKRNGRELRGEGFALNTLLMAEDVSLAWDNWDIDADIHSKFQDSAELLHREVVADGAVEYRIRSNYRLSERSTLWQDMIFYADSPQVTFETSIDWQDDHRFLKTAFDTTIRADTASHEVQFGYLRRSTRRNTTVEKAQFEVSNHKYTDLSEPRYGVAILNDCKYGISVQDSSLWLSLHKGGCRPDFRGDKGVHRCVYAFLPHLGGFSAGNVIQPAYRLNEKPLTVAGAMPQQSLVRLDCDHVVVETVKPAEKAGRTLILRLYEAEGSTDTTTLQFGFPVTALAETNMLEETQQSFAPAQELRLTFQPFEIKTIQVGY
ncbi:MAG: glycoside hydrolase family 38 C-terminal domain-containing protein [Gemmiger sp.]|nr:glycoside hydrolase family 38 C-terminal domain-containing protein [Gemmiger sp.]